MFCPFDSQLFPAPFFSSRLLGILINTYRYSSFVRLVNNFSGKEVILFEEISLEQIWTKLFKRLHNEKLAPSRNEMFLTILLWAENLNSYCLQ